MSVQTWLLAAVLGVALGHSAALAGETVDLNSAPATKLQELPGIGPKKAEAIIALRAKRPFTRVSQLLEVRGIGKKTLERLKPLVRLGDGEVAGTPGAARSGGQQSPPDGQGHSGHAPHAGP